MKIILMLMMISLISFHSVFGSIIITCIDSNTAKKTNSVNITVDGDTQSLVTDSTFYCASGCSETIGCNWGENWIFSFMIGVVILFGIGYVIMSPHVMTFASILGMSFSAIAIRYGFYIGDNYFSGSFIRLFLISLFIVFIGMMFWCIRLGKSMNDDEQDEQGGDYVGRR